MKKLMKLLLVLSVFATLFTACSNYGTRVVVPNSKGDVFYKGEGVTESDAKVLGDYLRSVLKYFDNTTTKSVQITKAKVGGGYDISFVIDKNQIKELPKWEEAFQFFGIAMSVDLYNEQPVNIIVTDDQFKEIKSFPFDKKKVAKKKAEMKAKAENKSAETTSLNGYETHEESGIKFFWKEPITGKEAELIGKAVEATGDFKSTRGNVEIIMEKEGDRYLVKFPIAPAYQHDEARLAAIAPTAKKIKDAAFANVPYSFVVVDEQLKNLKSFDY